MMGSEDTSGKKFHEQLEVVTKMALAFQDSDSSEDAVAAVDIIGIINAIKGLISVREAFQKMNEIEIAGVIGDLVENLLSHTKDFFSKSSQERSNTIGIFEVEISDLIQRTKDNLFGQDDVLLSGKDQNVFSKIQSWLGSLLNKLKDLLFGKQQQQKKLIDREKQAGCQRVQEHCNMAHKEQQEENARSVLQPTTEESATLKQSSAALILNSLGGTNLTGVLPVEQVTAAAGSPFLSDIVHLPVSHDKELKSKIDNFLAGIAERYALGMLNAESGAGKSIMWGGDLELSIIAQQLDVIIVLYKDVGTLRYATNIFGRENTRTNERINLYLNGGHYQAYAPPHDGTVITAGMRDIVIKNGEIVAENPKDGGLTNVPGIGNCLFHAISVARGIGLGIDPVIELRQLVSDNLLKDQDKMENIRDMLFAPVFQSENIAMLDDALKQIPQSALRDEAAELAMQLPQFVKIKDEFWGSAQCNKDMLQDGYYAHLTAAGWVELLATIKDDVQAQLLKS